MSLTIEKVQTKLNSFSSDFSTFIIATKTIDDKPHTSYAPFVYYDHHYYILISKIAEHYKNLKNNQKASIMLLTDESKSMNIFFRKRLSYAVSTILDVKDEMVKNEFVKRFGDMANTVFKLDFLIVKCIIDHGIFSLGPGQTFAVDKDQKIVKQITK
jgi:putative heme iron utilization protein